VKQKNIVAFGTENGIIKDLDIKKKVILRRSAAHDGRKVIAIAN